MSSQRTCQVFLQIFLNLKSRSPQQQTKVYAASAHITACAGFNAIMLEKA